MPKLIVSDRRGFEHEIEAEPSLSVMEIIRDNGIDELLALCGGFCSCATCHVRVAEEYMGILPPMTEEENELLDSSASRDARSRLACQMPFHGGLDGLRVTLATE